MTVLAIIEKRGFFEQPAGRIKEEGDGNAVP